MKIEEAKPGVRVKYAKGTIVDVPKGRGGEIVGLTRGPQVKRADVIVRFDGVCGLRYMPRSHLALEKTS